MNRPRVALTSLVNVNGRRTFFDLLHSNTPVQPQTYSIKRVLLHRPEVLYRVVANVDSYDQFLPYCQKSTVTSSDENNNPERATLLVGYKGFQESFESVVGCNDEQRVVTAEAVNAQLFDTLFTKWTIHSLKSDPQKCMVDFQLKFAFNNPLYNTVSKSFGPTLAGIMVKAFQDRAKQLDSDP